MPEVINKASDELRADQDTDQDVQRARHMVGSLKKKEMTSCFPLKNESKGRCRPCLFFDLRQTDDLCMDPSRYCPYP